MLTGKHSFMAEAVALASSVPGRTWPPLSVWYTCCTVRAADCILA